jgi:electron transfer flavoprotein alpha/beta subunit
MPLDVAVLLSVGRHPASGRSRRADLDARALELALRLGNSVRLHAIHAGDPGSRPWPIISAWALRPDRAEAAARRRCPAAPPIISRR